jgi:rRNA maturation RNase YbeY
VINGDIAISVERVKENSTKYNTFFEKEMLRVMAHGLLHLMGFDDKTDTERIAMQNAENIKIKMFHVEQ